MALRILHLEDDSIDAELVRATLASAGIECEILRVDNRAAFTSALETQTFDLILADMSLPSFDGIEGLALAKRTSPGVPFLFVSGSMGEELAVETLRQGAKDYVLKDRMARLGPAVRRALEEKRQRDEREKAEEALRFARFSLDYSGEAIYQVGPDARITYVNEAACRSLGYSREELLSMAVHEIDPDFPPDFWPEFWARCQREPVIRIEAKHRRKNGRDFPVEITINHLSFGGRESNLTFARDITERKQLEAQFRQAQKMEAVGTLAGGIAHDFNNILTVILGHCELLLRQQQNNDAFREEITEIQTAGARAATLTRQLLAFSRKQLLEPVVLDLNEVVTGLEKMLRRLIPEDIRITASLEPGPTRIKADRGQLEQIVMNLIVNARDAMAGGGQITIETKRVELDAAYAEEHGYVVPGPHVMLAVSDTGSGMDSETKSRIFEPFFTTKEQGLGTGLGLSTVYGIVKQSGGSIEVYSELGRGTVFKIYFPEFGDSVSEARQVSAREPARSLYGSETVLLVEDDTGLRSLARRTLEMYGYHVLEGTSAESAILATRAHDGPIHLLLTDTVMPGRSGPELVRILAAERPDLKVLYMSGYTPEGVLRHGLLDGAVAFLQKPFTPDALVAKVRSALDASGS
jgi:two-component system cell cycle sensor histidine kinase/response regulator CckA